MTKNGAYIMTCSVGNLDNEIITARFTDHAKLVHKVMGSKKLLKNIACNQWHSKEKNQPGRAALR